MFCLAALIPSPPVLVPELCGGAAPAGVTAAALPGEPAVAALRAAVLAIGRELAEVTAQWTVLGVGATDQEYDSGAVGTFRGFGPEVTVSLGGAPETPGPDPGLPLAVLIAGWLRGAVAPDALVRAQLLAADSPPARCAEAGAKLRAELDSVDEPQGVLVVADGAATLSTAAPGYFHPRAQTVQTGLEQALAAGDRAALLDLDPALCAELMLSGRVAYQAVAGLFSGDPEPPVVAERYRDAPFGVGYYAGLWRPGRAGR
ncbi:MULTISPECIES: hypothetical protein [Nocardia]|uniref:hypothetical protein n=1 Tax=Nocardia TaxID=1817 RepID=UPI0018938394|nr:MULTISPECIES: hypothetical protein [Nocardia]MBF6348780.1 hypothetical protein [Nocardia flavorosea]